MLEGQEFGSADAFYAREAAKAGMVLPRERLAEAAVRLWWQRDDVPPHLPTEVADGPPAFAEVNHANWIVRCPDPLCTSAQLAAREDPRFFCVACCNERTAPGLWLPVQWPDDPAAVEAVLRERDTVNANAGPSESVADLVAENLAADLTVPMEVL